MTVNQKPPMQAILINQVIHGDLRARNELAHADLRVPGKLMRREKGGTGPEKEHADVDTSTTIAKIDHIWLEAIF